MNFINCYIKFSLIFSLSHVHLESKDNTFINNIQTN
uniref:Uncharacterized protein n=1 Tax=CrAss-like virus sp. ctYsL76 TaxID=2826826 RepID=A0A8S5QMD4_9CAUD|nr:MAG TPA: hypothetical protein [CrAss-like virus sp. ctYsL76]